MATPERNPAPRHPARPRTAYVGSLGLVVPGTASQVAGSKRLSCVAGLRDLAWLGVAGSMVAMPSRSASVALAGHALATRAGVHARPRADGGVRVLSVTPGGLRTCPVSAEPAGATAVNGVSAAHDRATAVGAQPGPYRRLATPLAVSGAAGWRSRLHGGARSTSRGCHDPRVRRAESAGQYSAVMPWPSTTSSMRPAGSYFSGRRRAMKPLPRPTAVATHQHHSRLRHLSAVRTHQQPRSVHANRIRSAL